MLKKGLSVLIALIICFSAVTVLPSSAATESGYDSAAIGATLNYNGFNYTVDSNSKVTITGYTGSSESITIPAKINGNVVVGIGTGAFRGKTTITEVKIEAALTSMGNYAFGYCSGLKSVTINSGTTVLGYYAFGECSSLERVTLPGTLTTIGSYAFYRCSKLTQNITIPDSVTEIGSYAFESSGISSIKFGSKVQKIGASAFALCGNIVNVTLPDSVTSIGQGAFGTCGKLETVKIGNNVSEMGNYAFGYNDSLKEVYIAEGTTVIGKYAFAYIGSAYKSNLSKVTIPASVIKIGNANSENKVYKDNEVFGIGRTVTAVIHGVNGSFAQDFCNANAEACNLQWYNGGDTTKPSVSIYSENEVTSEQKVKLSMSDDFELSLYYWGLNSSTDSVSYTGISGKSKTIDTKVRSGGTYYLTVKDTSGNIAQASATFYKTTFDANGGSVSLSYVVTLSGNSFDFPIPTRSGYTFKGWATERTASSGIYTLKPDSDRTYYAIWSGSPADTAKPSVSIYSENEVTSEQKVTLSMSDNVGLAGYYWGTSSSTSPSFTSISGTSYTTTKYVRSGGTYYLTVKDTSGYIAQASAAFCRTNLDANGGSVSLSYVVTLSGNSFTFPTPTRSGYTFKGWATERTASSGIYTLKPDSDRTYYAIWSGSPADTAKPSVSIYSENEVTSEQKVTLSMSDNVGLAGYYWGTSSSKSPNFTSISGTSYTTTKYVRSGGTYYLTVKDTSGNIAQTSATFYMTTLDANGGSVSPSSVVTRSGYSFDFPTPLRLSVGSNGPDYMGWSTDRSASSGIYTLKPSSDQTYYAIWSDISADTTSPTASISSTNNVSSNQTVTLTMSDNVGLDGYYFRNIRSGVLPEYKKISGKNYSTTVTVSSSGTYQLTVYDTNGNSYNTSVTFCNTTLDANGGSVSPASVLTKYGNSFTMPTPTRSGYTFNGWSADSSASSGIYSLSPTLDQTYYAVWKSGSDYSLTLSPESVTMYVDESVTVNVKFSGDGIKYLGFEDGDGNICSAKWGSVDWSKGTGSFVLTGKKPGKKSFVVQLIDSSNNILYSESVFVTVIPKVDTQQSFVLTSTNDVASIQEVALEITEIKDIKGYYWGTNADYSKNKYVEVEYVDLGGSLHGYTDRWQNVDAPGTYYATLNFGKTISKTVSITFYKTTLNANGGSVSPAYVLTKAGNSFGFPTPSRSGYSYKGWSTSSSATSGVYYLTPTGNQVYYAVWGYDHSITFSPEDVTIYEGESITVTVKFTGDDVKKLRYVNGDDSICSASWGKVDWGTKTVPITFYGISPGTVTFDIQLLNSSEEEIYSKNISVKVLPKPSDALIKVLDAKGTAGKTVDVPITISGNPGVIGMTLSVSYDNSALELVGVKDAGILGNNSHKPEYTSPYTLSWANDTSVTNYTANGTIATLTFRIKDGVSAGKYDVRVSYDYDNYDIFDKDLNKVRFGVENGSVEVVNYIFGDVNSDGTVNNLDRVYLTRYLADWNDYQDIDLKAADVDCNGIVNNLDRVILTRYLANWADCSELPYRG